MPRGSEHRLIGLLVTTDVGFALEVDGGGRWHLDVRDHRGATQLCNSRVIVTGRRAGFDLLDVDTVTPV